MEHSNSHVEEGEVGEESDADSSGDDSSDDENESKNKILIGKLELEIQKDPYYYEGYKKLIKALQKDGDLEKLRSVREAMSLNYPLPEDVWIDWINDEKKVASNEQDHQNINKLYVRAVDDYLHACIWLDYVQYAIGRYDVIGIEGARKIFNKAVQAVGVHVLRGSSIWSAYREFEKVLLCGMQPLPGAIISEEQKKETEAQTNLITDLFRRQISAPLGDIQEAYTEYSEWCDKNINNNFAKLFESSKTKLEKLRPYEESLITSESPHYSQYLHYIDYCLDNENPVFIQCVFERAIQENCLQPDLWIKYTKYLDHYLQVPDICKRVHSRAVRNCPWQPQIWINYALSMERHHADLKDIDDIYNRALNCHFEKDHDYLKLWMEFCDYKRRQIKWNEDHDKELQDLRDLFAKAIASQDEYFSSQGDPEYSVMKYWAKIEAQYANNMGKSREIWKDIIYKSGGNKAEIWLQYIEIERMYGDSKRLRIAFHDAVQKVYNDVELIIKAYLDFEKQEGTLDDLDNALKKCESKMKAAEERLAQKAKKQQKNWLKQHKYDQKMAGKKQSFNSDQVQKGNVKNSKYDSDGFKLPQKRSDIQQSKQKTDEADMEIDDSNSEVNSSKEKMKAPPGYKGKTEVRPPPGYNSHSLSKNANSIEVKSNLNEKKTIKPPPGYKPQLNNDASEPPLKKLKSDCDEILNEPTTNDQTELSQTKEKSVFISNLEYTIDRERITEIFAQVGGLKDVRLIGGLEKGYSKGYGYVEFIDQKYVEQALKIDRHLIDKRPMFVSRVRNQKDDKPSFRYATNLERNKLFVKGLPFKMNSEKLLKMFEKHGKVKDSRIVTYRNGYSKGIAYVEFENESDASQAVLKCDGMEIDGKIIYVAISDPPIRKSQNETPSTTFQPSLGGGKRKDINERDKARTQLAFVPRNVKNNQADDGLSSNDGADHTNEKSSLSNKDFRALLLGNK